MIQAQWDRRIRRATELTSSYPFAAEGLRFYMRIATFQRRLYADIQKALAGSSKVSGDRPLRDELDLFLLLPKFSGFLSLVQQIAPATLAQATAGVDFSPALRRISCGPARTYQRRWSAFDLPIMRRQTDCWRLAARGRRCKKVAGLHVVCARMAVSQDLLSGVR